MRLPAAGLLQLLAGGAARPLQQVEDLGGLAAVAGTFGFLGGAGLLPRLGLLRRDARATWRNTGLFGGLRRGVCYRLRRLVLFRNRCHVFSFLGGDYRVTTSITQVGAECKAIVNRERRWNGDGAARPLGAVC